MSRLLPTLARIAKPLIGLSFHTGRLGITMALVVGCAGGESMGSDTEAASVGAMDDSGPTNVTETTGVTGLTATTGVPTGASTTASSDETTTGQEESTTTALDDSTGQTRDTDDTAETRDGSTSGEGSTSTTDDSASDTSRGGFVDLSGFVIHQTNTARSFTLPPATIVQVGSIVVVGRDATVGAFEQYWDVDLTGAAYFNTEDTFPAINGDETFRLEDGDGTVVDGPSIAIESGERLQRVDPTDGTPAGWQSATEATASPGEDMTTGDITFISEVSDATGGGSFAYEFVELHVGG